MTQQNIMPFTYGEHEVRAIKDGNGSVWWVAKDICRVIGLKWTNKALLGLENGCYQRPDTSQKPESLLPIAREFRAALRLARGMGLKGEQAVYEACRLAWKQTGVNPLNLINISDLLAKSLQKRRTARSEK